MGLLKTIAKDMDYDHKMLKDEFAMWHVACGFWHGTRGYDGVAVIKTLSRKDPGLCSTAKDMYIDMSLTVITTEWTLAHLLL